MRPLCQRLQHCGFNGDGRSTERPYSRYTSDVLQRTLGTSNLCRDARSCVRCAKGYSIVVLTGTDAQIVRPYSRYTSAVLQRTLDRASLQPLLVRWFGDGRTDRASLQPLHVGWFYNGRSTERPYSRYSSDGSGTDAQIVRPYNRYTSDGSTTDARPSVPTAVTRHARRVSAFLYL